jgi:hypothetical protein
MRTLHRGRHVEGTEPATQDTTSRASAWLWLGGGALLFFLVPFVGSDVLGLQPDLYYLVYFTVAVAWFAVFAIAHASQLHDLWRHNLGWSLAVGAVAGAGLVAMVFSQAGTDRPDGWRFAFEIIWRGLVYGSVDALTLFVFPAAVAYLLMHGNRQGAGRRAGFAGLALVLSLLVSTSYHLGYPEYRDADLRSPLIGTVVANVPTALTGNPLGAVVTHSMVHVAAVVHQHDGGSTQMLPPKVTTGYPSHGDSDVAAGLAALWLLGTGGALILVVRRRGAAPRRRADTTSPGGRG